MILNRTERRQLKRDNSKFSATLVEIPREQWPAPPQFVTIIPTRVWRSRAFLVQEYSAPTPAVARLSVNRTEMRSSDRWADSITRDELQHIKREIGYGDATAVEVFPPDRDLVNVANMRHLWILAETPQFVWTGKN